MANVLTSFLVGIGMDTTDYDKGVRDVERGMQGIKVTVLGISAALLGVFAGVATATVNTAHRVDQLTLATQNLNTSKQFVYDLGGAMKLMGGDAANALTEVRNIEEALTNLTVGDIGPLKDLAKAGVDISGIREAKTASEVMSLLADQVPSMTNPQKQLTQQALGLSDATMKAISGGGQEFEALIQRSQDLTGTIGGLTDQSRILMDKFAEFGLRMVGITNELTEKTLPGLVKFSGWANQFVEDHRDDISGVIDTVADNPGSVTALGGGAASATIGALLSKLGLTSLGGLASKAGTAGMIVGGATLATDATFDTLERNFPGLKSFEADVDQGARDMGLGKLVDFSNWLFNTGSAQSPEAMPTPYKDVTPASDEANDALVKAIQAAKVNVANQINLNVTLDGQALESKITEVQERSNYSTIDDVRSSTAR